MPTGDQALKLRQMVASRRKGATDAIQSDERAREGWLSDGGGTVIAITSGKGGVGKSVMTANLGLYYAMSGKKVLLLDADFGLANLDVMLGLNAEKNIRDVLLGETSIDDITLQGPEGIRLIPGGNGIRELANLSQSQVTGLMDQMSGFDQDFDVLLIDTAAGIAEGVSGVLLEADVVIVVTQPEPTAVLDAYAIIKTLAADRPGTPAFVVANRVQSEQQGSTVFNNLQNVAGRFLGVKLDFAGSIPEDSSLRESIRLRRPSLLEFPESNFSKAVGRIATTISRLLSEKERPGRGIGRFWSRIISQGGK